LGGEEFAIFLPDTEIDAAFQLADKIRETVSNSTIELDGLTVAYTVSLGIDSSMQTDHKIDELFKRADLKLYGAKDKGRNRVER
jgi:diguanylate cyclase (GGDEF)-like protein